MCVSVWGGREAGNRGREGAGAGIRPQCGRGARAGCALPSSASSSSSPRSPRPSEGPPSRPGLRAALGLRIRPAARPGGKARGGLGAVRGAPRWRAPIRAAGRPAGGGCREAVPNFFFFFPKQYGCGSSTISSPRCVGSGRGAPACPAMRAAALRRRSPVPLSRNCEVTTFFLSCKVGFVVGPLALSVRPERNSLRVAAPASRRPSLLLRSRLRSRSFVPRHGLIHFPPTRKAARPSHRETGEGIAGVGLSCSCGFFPRF